MTTKEWLNRARHIDDEINALLEAQQRAFTQATSTTSRLKEAKVVSSGGTSGLLESYVALGEKINRRVDELLRVKAEILSVIERAEDGTLRQLLMERYINGKTWEKVAVDMNYSYSNIIHRLHPAALRAVQELLEKSA